MSYTALYRKWRPATFDDVKGQDHIVQTLKNQITSGRIGHAYLFCGTRGTGKTSIAKIYARAVNCEHPVNGSPCGECRSCKSIAEGTSLNVVEIDAASNNGVENIREIREQVQYPPTEGAYRVYIIDEVHMLSTGAFNALLKTLEEPPSYVIFILATTEVHKIPITVLSRCQRYDFKRITIDTITARLMELAQAEHMDVEDRALRYVAKVADGSMRDALSLLDQCSAFHYGERLTYDNVLEVLGAVDTSVFSDLLRAVIEDRTTDCICRLEEMVIQGRELGQFVNDFIWYMRNLLLLKTARDAENMLDMSSDNLALLKEEADLVDTETLMRYIRVFSELSNQLRYASQKRVMVELAFIKLTRPAMEQDLSSVLQRLARIEKQLEEGPDPGLLARLAAGAAGVPPNAGSGGSGAESGEAGGADADGGEPRRVVIPRAQLEDLNRINSDWPKILREMGGAVRAGFKDTRLEPGGDGCLCIVFSDVNSYSIGNRPSILKEVEEFVAGKYGKALTFKARLQDSGEPVRTVYVSDEELKENIHMDITIED